MVNVARSKFTQRNADRVACVRFWAGSGLRWICFIVHCKPTCQADLGRNGISEVDTQFHSEVNVARSIFDKHGGVINDEGFPGASVEIMHPTEGMQLTDVDMPMPGAVLLRCRTKNFTLKKHGYLGVLWRNVHESGTGSLIVAAEPNTMFVLSGSGTYRVTVSLTTWDNQPLALSARTQDEANALQKTVTFHVLPSSTDGATRAATPSAHLDPIAEDTHFQNPWMPQPTINTAAYVVVITSDDFVDLVMAWAQSLLDAGSKFPRICLVAEGLVMPTQTETLRLCCCHVVQAPPIPPPANSKLAAPRYRWLMTKFQVWNLHALPDPAVLGLQFLRKVVLMDADTLVLQNIDELFWSPAVAATVGAHSLLGKTMGPTISTGVMVIEPSAQAFSQLLEAIAVPRANSLGFVEQEVLDAVFSQGSSQPGYTVLPFVYNFYPELTLQMDFVHPNLQAYENITKHEALQGSREQRILEDSLRSSVKVVHFWGWYNPLFAVFDAEARSVQNAAALRDASLWRWYRKWWRAHQQCFRELLGEEQYAWLVKTCEMAQRPDTRHLTFVPVLGSRDSPVCFRPAMGL